MNRTIYLFERGILGWQSILGDWKQWPNQAVAWINKFTLHKAQTLTYFCPATLAALTRPARAKQFAKLLAQYSGWRIILVCHSEGTATALSAFKRAHWPRIHELHLVCGACDSDFEANGLNTALANGWIGKVFVYVAEKDSAMRLENTRVGSLLFGLQTAGQPLGLSGATNEEPDIWNRVELVRWKDFGHSTCWDATHFAATMRQITATSERPPTSTALEKALSVLNK